MSETPLTADEEATFRDLIAHPAGDGKTGIVPVRRLLATLDAVRAGRAMTTERDADAAWEALVYEWLNGEPDTSGLGEFVARHRPRIEAALRAQGDSAHEHVWRDRQQGAIEVCACGATRPGPRAERDSATTEGAVLDVAHRHGPNGEFIVLRDGASGTGAGESQS